MKERVQRTVLVLLVLLAVLLPSFLVPLRHPRLLLSLLLLLPACEPTCLRCLLSGPIGYTESRYSRFFSVHQEIGDKVPAPPGLP